MSNTAPPSAGGASSNNFTPQPQPSTTTPGAGSNPATTSASTATGSSNQNLNQIVTDYLIKKGYNRTEEIFRQEVKDINENGKPRDNVDAVAPNKFLPAGKYLGAFKHFARWVDNGVDLYKFELGKILWPLFIYSYLRLVSQASYTHAQELLEQIRSRFEKTHPDELKSLSTITLSIHVRENAFAKAYLENQYVIPISKSLTGHLFHFLERDLEQCGAVILDIIQQHCRVDSVDRGPIEPFSFEAIYRRARHQELDEVDIQEGIPGVSSRSGLANRNILDNTAALKLGPLPIDPELRGDVVAELEEEDKLRPPREGFPTLVEEFNAMHPIKRESGDSPQRTDIPYPPSRARDVVMEMQKVRENRDRFRIEGRTGGVGPGVSVCMFTFHNHLGSISCMDFSKDQELVAVGTTESYIRVWSLDGKALKTRLAPEKDLKVNNRKLIGHSAPVYSVAFSDAVANLDRNIYEGSPQPETDSKLLLSCSADGQVRLWSLEVWACLCIYKGHDGPVFCLSWSPHGHYFVTGGWDKTVRVWSQDHASAQRLLVGHDTAISAVAWHPNGTYVFSASDETDKSIRMWSVVSGNCVRIFTGHTEYISAMECAPNGKILASADIGGNIFLWDIDKATRIKRCRGHGRGGIWSLSFSVESTVLVSGGQDNTVRVWDVEMPAEGSRPANQQDGDSTTVAAGGQGDSKQNGQTTQPISGAAGGAGKRKGKDVMITADQISAFATKKTPVIKVQFTRMNLVLAGGSYCPETQDTAR
ncbi:transcription initiation factor TFIID subunit 5 [Daldinia vernicosa]|uniref:transcription initiation factor TFIID subunit 5 n=1 Tax=Daldinia vernicosa TaxID=114800 RepID=UPI002008CE48|nr:transcription initiation factor TFIID subunit 5 [Daldinia vernicosa]KAI0847211.1 transcription initiation factor TFIID subunit 5 [Daldinia vernicosa]